MSINSKELIIGEVDVLKKFIDKEQWADAYLLAEWVRRVCFMVLDDKNQIDKERNNEKNAQENLHCGKFFKDFPVKEEVKQGVIERMETKRKVQKMIMDEIDKGNFENNKGLFPLGDNSVGVIKDYETPPKNNIT